jgi:hypothetical protein
LSDSAGADVAAILAAIASLGTSVVNAFVTLRGDSKTGEALRELKGALESSRKEDRDQLADVLQSSREQFDNMFHENQDAMVRIVRYALLPPGQRGDVI